MKKQSIIKLFLVSLLFSCHENTELKECEPEAGRFIKGQHFVPGNLMNENKRMDYIKWYHQLKNRGKFYPNCIPIEREKTLEEILEELAETADLNR